MTGLLIPNRRNISFLFCNMFRCIPINWPLDLSSGRTFNSLLRISFWAGYRAAPQIEALGKNVRGHLPFARILIWPIHEIPTLSKLPPQRKTPPPVTTITTIKTKTPRVAPGFVRCHPLITDVGLANRPTKSITGGARTRAVRRCATAPHMENNVEEGQRGLFGTGGRSSWTERTLMWPRHRLLPLHRLLVRLNPLWPLLLVWCTCETTR